MARVRRTPRTSGGLIAGWANVAAYFGVSVMTARRWAKQHGLPVVLMPGGGAMTSVGMVDLWMLSRLPRRDVNPAELGGAIAELGAALQASPAALAKVQAAIDVAVQDAVRAAVEAGFAARAEAASASGRLQTMSRAHPDQGAVR